MGMPSGKFLTTRDSYEASLLSVRLMGLPLSEDMLLRISVASLLSGVIRKSPSLVGLAVMLSTLDGYSLSSASIA